MTVSDQAQAAVQSVIDRLIEASRTLDGLKVETRGDGIAIEAARLALRRIADPELRDLINTVRR